MLDANRYTPLFNPRLVGDTPEDAEHFRTTNNNFANQNVSSIKREFVAPDDEQEHCPNCSRKFFSGRLRLHLKSCREGKPLKPIKAKPVSGKIASHDEEGLTVSTKHTEFTTNARINTLDTEGHETSFVFQDGEGSQEKLINLSPSNPTQRKTARELTFSGSNVAKDTEMNALSQRNKHNQKEASNNEICDNDEDDEFKPVDIADDVERQKAEDGRVNCTVCNRFFHEDRVVKHEKACAKSSKKRPVFNTTKQRAIPEQGGVVPKKVQETYKPKKQPGLKVKQEVQEGDNQRDESPTKKLPKWKAEHENFLKNLQFNRKIKAMEQRGEDTSHIVAPTIVNDSYVDCPHCFRKFAPATAERHIPKCKDTFNRPKPPRGLKLEKIEDLKNKLKAQSNSKKEALTLRKSSDIEPKDTTTPKKSANPNLSININEKLENVISYRSPKANLSMRNKYGQDTESIEQIASPKETVRLPHFISPKAGSKLVLKKVHSEHSEKQHFLPEIHRTEAGDDSGYEIQPFDYKDRSVRSQSPNSNKEGKKVFSQPIPKKESLLQNYQSIIARSSAYSTVTCPHCLRNFASHASERHIPICKNTQTRVMKKSQELDNSNEERMQPKMYLTNHTTKSSFKNRLRGSDDLTHPSTSPNGVQSVDYNYFLAKGKGAIRAKHPFALRKPLPGLTDPNITSTEKPSLFQNGHLVSSKSSFCTSCGTKSSKSHKFCGNCGSKKNSL